MHGVRRHEDEVARLRFVGQRLQIGEDRRLGGALPGAIQAVGQNGDVQARRDDRGRGARRVAQGDEFRVNTTTAGDQRYPSLAMNGRMRRSVPVSRKLIDCVDEVSVIVVLM